MSTETKWMQKSITKVGGAPGELVLTGPQIKPVLVTDPNVYPIPPVVDALDKIAAGKKGVAVPEVEELWQFSAEITGPTTPEDEVVTVIVWTLSIVSGLWRPFAPLVFPGDDEIVKEGLGRVVHVPGALGSSHVGLQVSDIAAGNSIRWLHEVS